jgi:hypothetical protein
MRTDQVSPQTVSPGAEMQMPPTLKAWAFTADAGKPRYAWTRARMAVPLPGTEKK